MNEHDRDASPVSFPVHVSRLPKKGMPVSIVANGKQKAALARAHRLESVESFEAELTVEPWKRNGVRVSGAVRANIVQQCVVTLDPVPQAIDEPVEGLFLPEDSKLGREGFETGGEIMLSAEGPDSPEIFSGDTVDVGALAEEFFGLAIDPYPRKAGVELSAGDKGGEPVVADWQQKLRSLAEKG